MFHRKFQLCRTETSSRIGSETSLHSKRNNSSEEGGKSKHLVNRCTNICAGGRNDCGETCGQQRPRTSGNRQTTNHKEEQLNVEKWRTDPETQQRDGAPTSLRTNPSFTFYLLFTCITQALQLLDLLLKYKGNYWSDLFWKCFIYTVHKFT